MDDSAIAKVDLWSGYRGSNIVDSAEKVALNKHTHSPQSTHSVGKLSQEFTVIDTQIK